MPGIVVIAIILIACFWGELKKVWAELVCAQWREEEERTGIKRPRKFK